MIYATTMADAEQRREDALCRLCLESVTSLETAGVDLLQNADVKKLLQDVYELQILPGDKNTTMMCMPCYQQLIKNYTLRMKLLMLRKTFRINQTMMVMQINAFKGTSAEYGTSKLVENDTTSELEKSTQTEEIAPTSTTMENDLENASEENDVIKSPPKPLVSNNITTKAATEKTQRQLVPIVLDCLKAPLYGNALWPLVLSTDRNDPAPLMLLCSACHETFKAKDKFDQHQSKGCVPRCRYCLSETIADHSCLYLKKYASIMPHIVGNNKYVTATTIPESDHDAGAESDARVDQEECDEPGEKKPNYIERVSSVERRSSTPNLTKRSRSNNSSSSHTKNLKSCKHETGRNTTLTAIHSTISISSSDEEPLVPVRKSTVVSNAKSARKRKRSTK